MYKLIDFNLFVLRTILGIVFLPKVVEGRFSWFSSVQLEINRPGP